MGGAARGGAGRDEGRAVDLTVVVLSWNTKDDTLAALSAVPAAAGALRTRVVCVDNASSDGTAAAVRAALPAALVLENPKNLGFARGNDAAIPLLAGRASCFLNSDAVPAPGSLEASVAYLDAHPTVGAVGPRLQNADGSPQRSTWPFPTTAALLHQYTALGWLGVGARDRARLRGERGVEVAGGAVDYVSAACLVIRTDLFVRLGGFDPGFPFYFEDIDLCRRLRSEGHEVHGPIPGPPVVHKGGASAAVAGGALRLPLLQGVLRYQRRRLPPRSAAAFAASFKLGVLVRTIGDALRWPLLHALRRVRGSPRRVSKSLAAQRARLRFLERDLGRFLRS